MSDGVDQACHLFGALPRPITKFVYDTAESINKLKDLELHPQVSPPYNLNTLEGQVADLIMQGERYDPTFEKLEKRFDPVLFWIKHKRVWGIPVLKRSNIVLENLYRKIVLLAIEQDVLTKARSARESVGKFDSAINYR